MNLKLCINGEEWGGVSYVNIPSLQYLCAENDLTFNLSEKNKTINIWSKLNGKKVWLSISGSVQGTGSNLIKQMESYLAPYGISVSIAEQSVVLKENELFMEITLAAREGGKSSLYLGLNSRLNSNDYSKLFQLYREYIDFKGYKLLSNNHDGPHLKCIVQIEENNEELLEQLGFLFTNCVLKSFFQNKTATLIDLNLINLALGMNSLTPLKVISREINKIDKKAEEVSVEEYEQAKLRKRNKQNQTKEPKAEIYFDYNLIPNRKTEKYTIKADFFIKNTGNVVLSNPKICFRVDPPEKIEIGGQILPPEMSEIFSVQGEMGAEGWKYSGKDWLEKAYSTGEYWIETIQGMELPPGDTTGIEGIQFTVDNLNEQETSTILGFVYFEEENLQLSSNNKIMITF
ncbi:hypothetical protein ACQ0QQ_16040 [Lysinibacillus sphaericus]